jgi:hypothetical protein
VTEILSQIIFERRKSAVSYAAASLVPLGYTAAAFSCEICCDAEDQFLDARADHSRLPLEPKMNACEFVVASKVSFILAAHAHSLYYIYKTQSAAAAAHTETETS